MNNIFWITQHHDFPQKNHKKIPFSVAATQKYFQNKRILPVWLDPNLNITDFLETQDEKQLKNIEKNIQATLDNLKNKTENKSELLTGCFGFFFKALDFSYKLHRRSPITQSFYNALQNTKNLYSLYSELLLLQKKITDSQNQLATSTSETQSPAVARIY